MTRSSTSAADSRAPAVALMLIFWILLAVPLSVGASIVYYSEAPWLWAVMLLMCIAVCILLFCLFIIVSDMEKISARASDPFDRRRPPIQ